MNNSTITEDRISAKDLLTRLGGWFKYMLSSWKPIVGGSLIIAGLYIAYTLLRKPVFTAETTFVIAAGSKGGGGLSFLGSSIGINLESLTGQIEWFTSQNILELYKSYRILKQTLLAKANFDGEEERLITRYCDHKKLWKDWEKEEELNDLTFEIPESQMTILHDSIIMVLLEDIKKEELSMYMVSRKASIISVKMASKDQLFAKYFNEELVRNVNDFYVKTRTKKTLENVVVLENQLDSIRTVLNRSIALFKKLGDKNPNPNPYQSKTSVNSQKTRIDLETSAAVYEEIVKRLEIARIEHQTNTPLIQIIDSPVLPLEDDKPRKLVMVLTGGLLGGFIMVAYFSLKRLYRTIMEEDPSS